MSARISGGRAQLLTRTGLDWSDKYPSVIAALARVRAKAAYLDGELCGVGDDGLPSFSQTQAASDGSHGIRESFAASARSLLVAEEVLATSRALGLMPAWSERRTASAAVPEPLRKHWRSIRKRACV
jgi:hypothetical protein